VDAINELLYGPYWWSFWILQIGLGTLIPLVLLVIPNTYRHTSAIGWLGILVLVGFAAARANIIFPALSVPELEGLANAFTGPHLSFEYFPSLMEWSVTIGVVGGATLAFLIGLDYLPLYKNEVSK
jgi:molybdopterin-containing oxidoreductase family membrane subunit